MILISASNPRRPMMCERQSDPCKIADRFRLQRNLGVYVIQKGLNQLAIVDHETVSLAAGYLVRACKPDGQFTYRVNLDPTIIPKLKYNVLRHAGAMYALAVFHQRRPDEKVRDAVVRAGRFLRDRCISPVAEAENMNAVWSRPEMTGAKKLLGAKLGGAGLGLVALVNLEAIATESTPIEQLRQLGRFVVYMQKADGSFYSKYIPAKGGRRDAWTSLYYPGEATLGLLMLYELDESPVWIGAAANALGYLARSREGDSEVPADHWALLATAKLLAVDDRCDTPVARDPIVAHAIQICESILRQQVWTADDPLLIGGFSDDGRTTPTATRLEGLLAALTFLSQQQQQDLRERITSSVHEAMSFLVRSQVRQGEFAGAIPRAYRQWPADDPRSARSFNRRATEVRIDYVQHAMSAMIQYLQTFCSDPTMTDSTGKEQ
ncbi:MAG: hypothetical protein V3T84_00855 [Phycisphaerales bacterium]